MARAAGRTEPRRRAAPLGALLVPLLLRIPANGAFYGHGRETARTLGSIKNSLASWAHGQLSSSRWGGSVGSLGWPQRRRCCSFPPHLPSLTPRAVSVSPVSGLLDAPFHVRVTGLRSGSSVQVRLSEAAFPSGTLTLRRTVKADSRGVVDLGDSRLLALVSSKGANAGSTTPRFTREITLSLVSGGKAIGTTQVKRIVAPDSVTVRELRPAQGVLYGEYLVPSAASKHSAVLLLGGSDGGMPNGYAASLLAAHGYPVLALAYFGEPGLPPALEKIPLEYFQRALVWLGKQPEADPKRLTAIGTSRGGELALPARRHLPAARSVRCRLRTKREDQPSADRLLHGGLDARRGSPFRARRLPLRRSPARSSSPARCKTTSGLPARLFSPSRSE